jgi:hypothetical protein
MIYTIYTPEGKRATTACFVTRHAAELHIVVLNKTTPTAGLYVDEVKPK